jgi:CRISPR-associated protein Csc1
MTIGRAQELAPESEFEFFVLSAEPIRLPRWIRLGKWMSKAEEDFDQDISIHHTLGLNT